MKTLAVEHAICVLAVPLCDCGDCLLIFKGNAALVGSATIED
jgi:hypothetical protein